MTEGIIQIGTKIYYEKNTGNKIVVAGDIQGYVVETTTEQDFENYAELKKYDKEAVGKIQLEYGELNNLLEEHKANSYKVDVSGEEPKLVFSWINYETGEPGERPKTAAELLDEKIDKTKTEIMEAVIRMQMDKPTKISAEDVPPLASLNDIGIPTGVDMSSLSNLDMSSIPKLDSSMIPPAPQINK